MSDDYNPNSHDAVLSRIETKLDTALKVQEEHATAIRRLWKALDTLKVKVVAISAGIGVVAWVVEIFFKH